MPQNNLKNFWYTSITSLNSSMQSVMWLFSVISYLLRENKRLSPFRYHNLAPSLANYTIFTRLPLCLPPPFLTLTIKNYISISTVVFYLQSFSLLGLNSQINMASSISKMYVTCCHGYMAKNFLYYSITLPTWMYCATKVGQSKSQILLM